MKPIAGRMIAPQGNVKACAVRTPGFGGHRTAMLENLVVLTRGTCMCEEVSLKLEKATIEDSGRANKSFIVLENTAIVDGAAAGEAIQARIERITVQRVETSSDCDCDWDREMLQERVAKPAGRLAFIGVAASTRKPRIKVRNEGVITV